MKRLVVDHDHECCPDEKSCGKCVRGLLCNWCNRMIGMARDDPQRLRSAIAYLKRTGSTKPAGNVRQLRPDLRPAAGDALW